MILTADTGLYKKRAKNLGKPTYNYDDLDIMLGLQLVSCPSAFYGKGGVGTLASKLSRYGKLSNKIVPQHD